VYHEQPSRVPGAFTWTSVSTGAEVRVLPDGCMDLLWDGRGVVIAGPDTRAQRLVPEPGFVLTGLASPRIRAVCSASRPTSSPINMFRWSGVGADPVRRVNDLTVSPAPA
jgi:hypothetical protein